MAGCIDEIEFVDFTIPGRVIESDTLRLDRDPSLAFDVHGIQHLIFHFPFGQAAA